MRHYIEGLLLFSLLARLMLFLLPNSKYERYMKLSINIIFICIILTPICKITIDSKQINRFIDTTVLVIEDAVYKGGETGESFLHDFTIRKTNELYDIHSEGDASYDSSIHLAESGADE